jgi:hypothetical protein
MGRRTEVRHQQSQRSQASMSNAEFKTYNAGTRTTRRDHTELRARADFPLEGNHVENCARTSAETRIGLPV